MRPELARQGRIGFISINIVYEPIYDENIPVLCFFTDQIYLTYRSYITHFEKGKELILNRVIRQCYYCENFFAKNDGSMKKHTSICIASVGITYSFDNDQIINFQDNLKYLGDVPFTANFDFETTTGNSAFFDPKMFVMSYCQIYSFHPSINLNKIVIF